MVLNAASSDYAQQVSVYSTEADSEVALSGQICPKKVVDAEEYERLHKQATRLQHLLQVMPAGVVVIDGKGIVKQANKLAKELLGEPLEGQLWRHIIQRSFDPREDDGHEVSLHDGRKVKLSITPLIDEPGQLIVITDLTETRRLQQRISHMQRLSSLGKTVASLVHQIRTPLSAAILYAANLGNKNLTGQARERFSEKLQSRLKDLEFQVNDMLLFAKSGEQQVVKPCAIEDLLRTVEAGCEAMMLNTQGQLTTSNQAGEALIMGNETALTGAIQNLVHNAAQIKGQGVEVCVQVSECQQDKQYLLIEVSDNGPGIPENVIGQIFEPFFTTKSQGTGLGLAVVASVAKTHGGNISVANLQQGGACFRLRLPRYIASQPVQSKQQPCSSLNEGVGS